MAGRRARLRLVHDAGRGRGARSFPCDTNPYGLTRAELRREIARLTRLGWLTWEIRRRFCPCDDPESSE
jgi:hypothetical protein